MPRLLSDNWDTDAGFCRIHLDDIPCKTCAELMDPSVRVEFSEHEICLLHRERLLWSDLLPKAWAYVVAYLDRDLCDRE